MKKNIKIILIFALLILFAVAIVYATNVTTPNVDVSHEVSPASISLSSDVLAKLDSDTSNLKSKVVYDELQSKSIYEIENSKYFIDMDTNNNLVGIHSKAISATMEASNFTYDMARDYITQKYELLNLPADYELNYLEKYDDLIWQANFEKNYNGVYNKYESVKVYFIPDSNEIVALGVFRDAPTTSDVQISEEMAIQTASKDNQAEIVSTTLGMEKADDNKIHSAYTITYSDNNIVFVDAESNQIIGGDTINE